MSRLAGAAARARNGAVAASRVRAASARNRREQRRRGFARTRRERRLLREQLEQPGFVEHAHAQALGLLEL